MTEHQVQSPEWEPQHGQQCPTCGFPAGEDRDRVVAEGGVESEGEDEL